MFLPSTTLPLFLTSIFLLSIFSIPSILSLKHIVIAGGTGRVGKQIITTLLDPKSPNSKDYRITVLARNKFLASAPNRVSGDFGYLGKGFISRYPGLLTLRDYDGGDLLDIVGMDWMGWEEVLADCDLFVNAVGTFTEQRTKAVRRFGDFIEREENKLPGSGKKSIKQLHISPTNELLRAVSKVAVDTKIERVRDCEIMLEIGGCGGCYNFARVMGLEGLGEKVGELAGMEDEEFRKFVV
ncbi:hypothetical protein TrRE_jg8961 [Triparma retinervis]|uniref:NAD(P)-binding domain-containing protein n=1 Tax=Triparma retinervis TaxID=2557542 RepID=A0A9W7E4U8_9STRA|nr:hypothetical protein TrRE_jg8961 [Triparma retinervis]